MCGARDSLEYSKHSYYGDRVDHDLKSRNLQLLPGQVAHAAHRSFDDDARVFARAGHNLAHGAPYEIAADG